MKELVIFLLGHVQVSIPIILVLFRKNRFFIDKNRFLVILVLILYRYRLPANQNQAWLCHSSKLFFFLLQIISILKVENRVALHRLVVIVASNYSVLVRHPSHTI